MLNPTWQALERNAKGRRVMQYTGRKASGFFHLVRPGAGVHTNDMSADGEQHLRLGIRV